MRIKNLDDLDHRIKELTEISKNNKSRFWETSDRTRNMAGSVQQGFYLGQMALGLFRTLTNYHLPPKKRIQRILVTVSTLIVANAIRHLVNNRIGKKAAK